MENIKSLKFSKTFFKNTTSAKRLLKKIVASATAVLSLAFPNATALANNFSIPQQSANIISYKKSQVDEYEDILTEIRNMSDKEIKEKVAQARKKHWKLWEYYEKDMQYLYMGYGDRFDYENASDKDLAADKQGLSIYMHLDAFFKKYPEYFNSFLDDFFSETIDAQELSDTEVTNRIEEEKERFKKLGTSEGIQHFEIEDEIENSVNPRIFLLSIRKLNNILEKYSKLTDTMLNVLKRNNAVFRINSFAPNDEDGTTYVDMYTEYCRNEHETFAISLSKTLLNDTEYLYKSRLIGNLDGFDCYVEKNELIPSIIAHETGHVFEFLMFDAALGVASSHNLKLEKTFYEDFDNKMKEKIIETSKGKYGAGDAKVSRYAEKNSTEWFAEVFANLECANEENISPYGKALRDILNNMTFKEFESLVLEICNQN